MTGNQSFAMANHGACFPIRSGMSWQVMKTKRAIPAALTLALAMSAGLFGAARDGIVDAGQLRVIDGDTVALGGERIRLDGIDAPELSARGGCIKSMRAGAAAKAAAEKLLQPGHAVRIVRTGQDDLGRTLARIAVNGRDLGETLIRAGLAVRWNGRGKPPDFCAAQK